MTDALLAALMEPFVALLATFAISLVPLLELRAGIPLGVALGLPAATATAAAVLGNVLQIPVARTVVALAYRGCARWPKVRRWLAETEARVARHGRLIRRWGWLGLAAFVLLPLPGTGVWGGVVLARLLSVAAFGTWLGLALGVAASGVLFGLGAHGTVSLLQWLR